MEKCRKIVLFFDVAGFMKAFGEQDTSRLTDFLQDLYLSSGDEIVSSGGEVVKYMGDAVLAVFPEDTATAAVADCVLKIRDRLRSHAADKPYHLDLAAGVCTGAVSQGEIGHPSLRLADVFGPPVNKAAILLHAGVGLRFSEELSRDLGDEFALGAPGEFKGISYRTLKGRSG